MHSRTFWVAASIVTFAVAIGCGGSNQAPSTSAPPSSPAATPAGQKVDESKAGSLTGKVVFEGTPPKNELQKLSADPVCVKENKGATRESETYVVSDGGLENVFVYVKDGLGNYVFDTPTDPVTIDQQGCRYHPHVFGIRIGQPLQIINSDPTMHNIHAVPKTNDEFNTGQPIQGQKTMHTFTTKEIMVPFKCDVHGWMNAYVGVLDHPYFATSGKGGKFEIKTLPPGKYTIEAWHEKLGTQTQEVTVGEKETKDLTFTFKATS